MGCVQCNDGSWVCEPANDDPSGGCPRDVVSYTYRGRYQLDGGKLRVWCRGSDVSISQCEPLPDKGGTWTLAGCADLSAGAWDLYLRPGNPPMISLDPVDQDCSPCE